MGSGFMLKAIQARISTGTGTHPEGALPWGALPEGVVLPEGAHPEAQCLDVSSC